MSEIKLSRAIGLLEGTIKGMKAFGNFNKEGALESLEEVKTILENYSPGNDSGQGWIDCKEKLPEHLEFVLVYNTERATLVARLFDHDWVALFSDGEKEMGELTATHWRPLPTPPNESK